MVISDTIREIIEKKQISVNSLKILGICGCLVPVIISYIVTYTSEKFPVGVEQFEFLRIMTAGASLLLILYLLYRVTISKFVFRRSCKKTFDEDSFKEKLKRIIPEETVSKITDDELKNAYGIDRFVSHISHFLSFNVALITAAGIALSLYINPLLSVIFAFYGILLSWWVCGKILPRMEKM